MPQLIYIYTILLALLDYCYIFWELYFTFSDHTEISSLNMFLDVTS